MNCQCVCVCAFSGACHIFIVCPTLADLYFPVQAVLSAAVYSALLLIVLPTVTGSMAPKLARRIWKGSASVNKKPSAITKSYARMDAWARGMIWALHLVETPRERIVELVDKTDGSNPTVHAVDEVIGKKKADDSWRGEDAEKSGRPPALTTEESKQVVRLVFKKRGRAVVTVPFCKKQLPFLRKVGRRDFNSD